MRTVECKFEREGECKVIGGQCTKHAERNPCQIYEPKEVEL